MLGQKRSISHLAALLGRRCCGDVPHYDLSVYAFEKLADLSWGVIGINWRRVPCDHQPAQQAPPIANPWCVLASLNPLMTTTRRQPYVWCLSVAQYSAVHGPGKSSPDGHEAACRRRHPRCPA